MISSLLIHLFRYSVPLVFVCMMWKLNARRWTRLARAYRAPVSLKSKTADRVAKRTMQTVILLAGDIGWNSYKGIATVSVTREGILLELMPLFSIFHPPLLIPYGDCDIEPRQWYLVGRTYQYTLRGVSDVKMIIHDDLQDWIESQVASLATTNADTRISDDKLAGIHAI